MKLFRLFKFLNRCKFKIGDRVICVNDSPLPGQEPNSIPPLIYKKEYIVENLSKCKCGSWSVDVGLRVVQGLKKSGYTTCECKDYIPGKGIHWCHIIRFEKTKSEPAQEEKEAEFKKISFTEKLTVKILEEEYEIGQN